jgi:Ca2+-binding RTX toxin-like protein
VVLARRFDKDGAPAGDAFRLSDTEAQQITTIAANDAGRVFTAWMSGPNKHTTDPDLGINGKILRPATETVNGTPGNDTITTYSLSEPINGLGGKDKIDARGGDDLVSGGEGKDTLTGGLGADGFRFDVKLKGKNADHITDFTPGVDSLVLDKSIFKKLKVGELKTKSFFAKKKADEAKDGKDRIVYDTKSGDVWFDKDGKGGSKAKLFATLDGSPDLAHTDILVIA